jgi:hypothetical protein
MIERAAAGANQEIKAHPHMLRHACGYALADKRGDTPALFRAGSAIGRSPGPPSTGSAIGPGYKYDKAKANWVPA